MSEPAGIMGLVTLSPGAFRRYARSQWVERVADRLHAVLRQRDAALLFTYLEERNSLVACEFQEFARGAELLESPVLAALLALGEYKDLPGEDLVVVSESLLNFASDPNFRAYLVSQGATRDLGPRPELPRAALTAFATVWPRIPDPHLGEEELLDCVDPSVVRALRNRKNAKRREMHDLLRAATPKAPIDIFYGYRFDGTKVFDPHDGKPFEGMDPFTLRMVHAPTNTAADAKRIWQGTRSLEGAHSPSFKVLGGADGIYALDRERAYRSGQAGWEVIPQADRATFVHLDFGYAKDRSHVYNNGRVLDGVGLNFEIDGCGFLRAEHAIYHYEVRLDLDPASFEVIDMERHLKSINPHIGPYRLRDRSGVYRFTRFGMGEKLVREADGP
ncbi:DKNYY family protein [Rhizobiales bacterium GAS191]|jgi:hypothetical protein|nr:DKNYY family protein [Rhizobiales bacterium GAS113]SEC55885.1 DKNYY family protein [Rhizobiales bacterium GAS191]